MQTNSKIIFRIASDFLCTCSYTLQPTGHYFYIAFIMLTWGLCFYTVLNQLTNLFQIYEMEIIRMYQIWINKRYATTWSNFYLYLPLKQVVCGPFLIPIQVFFVPVSPFLPVLHYFSELPFLFLFLGYTIFYPYHIVFKGLHCALLSNQQHWG